MWQIDPHILTLKIEDSATRLVLASASPRRADLLRAAGIDFDVEIADVDETPLPGETPHDYVRRLAEAKARAVAERMSGRFVLGADTAVVIDGEIFGKPEDAADAERMLTRLSGRAHEVMTGVALVRLKPDATNIRLKPDATNVDVRVATTLVEFAAMTPAEVRWYVASGEPVDKAGAYAIQGLASRFVTRIDGSYSNVVGLPVAMVYAMCTRAGILVS